MYNFEDEGGEEIVEDFENERANRLQRKKLTKNRLVHSINSALNLENYNPYTIPNEENEITGNIKVDRNKDNDINILFSNQPGRQNRANLIIPPVGVRQKARHIRNEREAFGIFVTPDMINIIVENTNRKITNIINKLPIGFNNNFKYSYVRLVNTEEIYAFIGLMLYRGLYQLNTISVQKLFSAEYGPPTFSATMSRTRFKIILRCLSFDDEGTRDDRWKTDRFAAFREFFEVFIEEFCTCLAPEDYLSLDETLYPMRNQISFRQYNPNKPAKYGMLFKSINTARYSYTFVAAPYCGKPVEEGGAYYIQGTEPIVKQLVQRIEGATIMRGQNISFDRLYTSIPLVRWLYDRDITSI